MTIQLFTITLVAIFSFIHLLIHSFLKHNKIKDNKIIQNYHIKVGQDQLIERREPKRRHKTQTLTLRNSIKTLN